jgi:hypothetical protein
MPEFVAEPKRSETVARPRSHATVPVVCQDSEAILFDFLKPAGARRWSLGDPR